MIENIITFSVRNRWLVILAWLGVAMWGVYAVLHTPIDAIPDLSENQVIVFTDWEGRSPTDIEEQITLPLGVQLQGLAGVKTVRSSSEFGFSMINIIFDEHTDFYFARQRVLERLTTVATSLPAGVIPVMAPDATALGQIFWYTVEGDGRSLDELRALQDFTVKYQLASVAGVSEVASVGGFVREYQVDVSPDKLRLLDVPLRDLIDAIQRSNLSVGGKVVNGGQGGEYVVRGAGWLTGPADLERVVVANRGGVPVLLHQLATVQLGPAYRRGALEKDGQEAVGGVVMMRFGRNPLEVTRAIKAKIRDMQPGLPPGVRVVPFYERTRLIESAIHTVTRTLEEEIIIASLAVLLILMHFRSALVVCVTLPMAVLVSFLLMYYLSIPSNIMSLCGIAISIGILVDAAVVMVENASHELTVHFGTKPVRGDTTEIVVRACRLVGRPIFFSVVIMLVSFLPVFSFGGQEGKLSHPLAFTKTFAMVGVALIAITLVPAMIPIFIKGRLRSEEENPIVRSFVRLYKPMLSFFIDRPGAVWWIMGVILVFGSAFIGSTNLSNLTLALAFVFVALGVSHKGWKITAVLTLAGIAFWADTRFTKLGSEFRPELDEGSVMDMPVSAPRITMGQAVDDVKVRDRILRSFPEVESVVGKIGRAETATDPSPTEMVETVVNFTPRTLWPKRKLQNEDALAQTRRVADALKSGGFLKETPAEDVFTTANSVALEKFDRHLRDMARARLADHEPAVTDKILDVVYKAIVRQIPPAAFRTEAPPIAQLQTPAQRESAGHLVEHPRIEEVDLLVQTMRSRLVELNVVADQNDLLADRPGVVGGLVGPLRGAIGIPVPPFAERVLAEVEETRERAWAERVKTLNWELFDEGTKQFNALAADAVIATAAGTSAAGPKPTSEQVGKVRDELSPTFAKSVFLWQKSKADLVDEMNAELQMPGWGNVWTQPIKNRIDMLATGVRTQIGVKVFGPTGKPIDQSVEQMQTVSEEISARLRDVRGAVDVVADQAQGKRYVQVHPDRERAARYGVNVADVTDAIETALGGTRVTTTVEGRQRFAVRLRYERDSWQDVERIGDILVTGRSTGPMLASETASVTKGAGPMYRDFSRENRPPTESGMVQVPLRAVADISTVEGPSMIRSEDGRLRQYVTLNVRGRDVVGFVDEARQALQPVLAKLAGTGMTIEWTGEFENLVRTRQTLTLIFPLVVALILFLLYWTFRDNVDVLLVSLAVLGALCGSVMFQALFGFNFSLIVAIGYIAAFGMATQTGVIMLVYLREALDRRGGLENIESLEALRAAVIEGAVHRLRPKLLTEGVAIVGLVPMLWATGTGSEIMRPMAAPVLGGLLIADEVVDMMLPVLFYRIRRRRWLKLHGQSLPMVVDPKSSPVAPPVMIPA